MSFRLVSYEVSREETGRARQGTRQVEIWGFVLESSTQTLEFNSPLDSLKVELTLGLEVGLERSIRLDEYGGIGWMEVAFYGGTDGGM